MKYEYNENGVCINPDVYAYKVSNAECEVRCAEYPSGGFGYGCSEKHSPAFRTMAEAKMAGAGEASRWFRSHASHDEHAAKAIIAKLDSTQQLSLFDF